MVKWTSPHPKPKGLPSSCASPCLHWIVGVESCRSPDPDNPETTNYKHQISNKFQIAIFNFQIRSKTIIDICNCFWQCFNDNRYRFWRLECPFFKIIRFGVLNFSHCDLFVICFFAIVIYFIFVLCFLT